MELHGHHDSVLVGQRPGSKFYHAEEGERVIFYRH
jgi:hypothetical protein